MPDSTRTPAFLQSEQICRFAGADVAKLLRDIGEASASTNPVELFRLCLDAQHFLSNVHNATAAIVAAPDAVLLVSQHASAIHGQTLPIGFVKQGESEYPRQRAPLGVMKFGQATSEEAV